jgi:hypothetical protein
MAPKESEGGVFITTKDIYDEVKEMRDDVKEVVDLLRDTVTDVRDHESRIRSLERWKYALPASLFLALAGLADHIPHIGK